MASHAMRSQTWTQILQPMHSSNRICTFGITTFTPSEVSRGVCSMQSTGQKLTQASQPVQLSGITTAISFGFFFFRVIFAGASGMIRVGFAFLGSYATYYCTPSKLKVHSTRIMNMLGKYVILLLPSQSCHKPSAPCPIHSAYDPLPWQRIEIGDCHTPDDYAKFADL